MKDKGIHESCIHQMYRLCKDKVYNGKGVITDENIRIRLDDWEMRSDVQEEIENAWNKIDESNMHDLTDFEGFKEEFYHIHGFEWSGVDYDTPVEL